MRQIVVPKSCYYWSSAVGAPLSRKITLIKIPSFEKLVVFVIKATETFVCKVSWVVFTYSRIFFKQKKLLTA
jgi:hypothetical protein